MKAGHVHVVDADLKGYFDSIPHAALMDRLQAKIADGRVLSLIESFLKAGVVDGVEERVPASGAPQGAVLSPLLSNVYLDPLEHLMAQRGFEMVRYADEFVILCRSAEEAERALELVRKWVRDNGLTLHPTKTQIVDSRTESFSCLGYDFLGTGHWPRKKSLQKLKDALRAKTRRTSGDSLSWIIIDVNRTLRGWFNYFQHSTRRSVYSDLDSRLRMRLRSLLRRRAGGRGVARDQKPVSSDQTPFSPLIGCSVWQQPIARPANPHEGKTINRRAGCGRTARPVRRGGSPKPIGLLSCESAWDDRRCSMASYAFGTRTAESVSNHGGCECKARRVPGVA